MATVAKNDYIQIERLELGPWPANAYIVICPETKESVVIDAPAEASVIADGLAGTNPKYILLTHTHPDHIGALSDLRSLLNVPVAAHSLDGKRLTPPPETQLGEGDTIPVGRITLEVLHTPGHTPGSLCLLTDKHLISGDTIFPGGPGKTASPDSFRQIVNSLTEKIFILPDDTEIHPGHGGSTVLKKEKGEFEVFSSRPTDPNLCGDVQWLTS